MRTKVSFSAALLSIGLVILTAVPPAAATTGQVHEFPAPDDSWGITTGPDGNLWFTEFSNNKIGRITPSGTVTEFSGISTGGLFYADIAAGPDGNVWFPEYNADKIGRITPSGTITEFSGLTSGAQPNSITTGPDGNLWFTENGTNKIGVMNTSGTVLHEYSGISAGGLSFGDITAGPDGNLWFTEPGTNKIGVMDTSGTVLHEYSVTTSGANLQYITAGPDGNMWFTECGTNAVGRITPSGTIAEFSGGITSGSCPEGISAGFDGDLWFGEDGNGAIGRITPSGSVTEFSSGVTSNADTAEITAGVDGNEWFAEQSHAAIGRAHDAAAGIRYDLVRDYSFTPKARSAVQGNKVKWMFLGPNEHSVADTSGMNLFHSGTKTFVKFYTFKFNAAGTYAYHSTLDSDMKGTVKVPEKASPSKGHLATTFHVTWSAAKAPAGYVFDVQIKKPGGSFSKWKTSVTSRTASFKPNHGKGKYSFRSRIRKKSNGAHSGWSPAATISVT